MVVEVQAVVLGVEVAVVVRAVAVVVFLALVAIAKWREALMFGKGSLKLQPLKFPAKERTSFILRVKKIRRRWRKRMRKRGKNSTFLVK